MHILPVKGDGHEGENTGANGENSDKLADLAVKITKGPVTVQHVSEIEGNVEGRYHGIGDAEIHQKVIRHCSHSFVSQNDPYDNEIATGSYGNHEAKRDCPNHLTPPW